MWMDKLADGVLQIDTPIGPRYVRLTFRQRAYMIWMFRNFSSLPQQVLSAREQRFIDRVCEENGFASMPAVGASHPLIIGRIENRMPSPAEILPMRRPAIGTSPVREQSREAASA